MRRPDEISLMSAMPKNSYLLYPYRPLCSRHFALKISTLISKVMAKLRTPNM